MLISFSDEVRDWDDIDDTRLPAEKRLVKTLVKRYRNIGIISRPVLNASGTDTIILLRGCEFEELASGDNYNTPFSITAK